MDFEKRLAELEADRERTIAMIQQVEAQANAAIAAFNKQGADLTRNLHRIEGAAAFIKAEILSQAHQHDEPSPAPLVEVATS